MKLRLPLNRPIGAGLVTLCAGLTREAAEQLAGLAAAPVGSVHRARVALKRTRSVLRLLEKAGAAWAIMPRYRLAQLGRLLSDARETAVATALAANLARRLRGREREVAVRLAKTIGQPVPPDTEQIQLALRKEAVELALAPAPVISPAQLRGLLRQSLDRTARRYYDAAMKPTLESVHEWRKAVIVLRDQTALAAARWPQGAGVAHPLLARFARQLGDRGDLALLGERLSQLRLPMSHQPARRSLITRLQAQREQATLTLLLRWLRLERRLIRLLAEETKPRQAALIGE